MKFPKVKLKDIAAETKYPIGDGDHGAIKPAMYQEKGVPYIRVGDMDWNGNILFEKMVYISDEINRANPKSHLYPGDILISKTGATIGKVVIIPDTIPISNTTASVGKVSLNHKKAHSSYVFWSMKSHDFQEQMWRVSHKSAQPGFNVRDLKEFNIPLPPLKTQKQIASILDNAAALLDKTEQLLKEYDLLAQSIFLDMFGDPVVNPRGWKVSKLDNLTNLITDGKHGNCNDEENSGYYFISAKDIRNNKINFSSTRQIPKSEFEEVNRRTNLQPGDLVMINTGATIGRMAIAEDIPETRRMTFQKSVAVIKTKKDVLIPLYLQYVFELRLETFATKGSGSAIKNLLLSEMKRFKIIIPPINLQTQFAKKIALIEQQKVLAKQELQEAENLFNCLLQKAFKGELV